LLQCLTGHASFDNRVDFKEEMAKLFDVGVAFGNAMNLAPGVTLTKEHVDALRENCVWVEEVILDGKKIWFCRICKWS
jgi:hypothetical protein